MRILLIGATGTIGRAVAAALAKHDVILASRKKAPDKVDISDPESIRALYSRIGRVDAVVNVAGQPAWKPLLQLTDQDFASSVRGKLMGQVNVVRYGVESVNDRGSFTLTSGVLAHQPTPGSAAVSMVNAAIEAFAAAAALDLPRGIRVNVVSPPWVTETLQAMRRPTIDCLPAATVAKSYVASVEGDQSGNVIMPRG